MLRLLGHALKKALAIMAVSAAVAGLPILADAVSTAQAATAIKEGTIDLGPVRLFYLDTGGTGETVILMHPATASSDAFRTYQIEPFAKAGYRVVAYDRRNYGKSYYDAASPPPGTTVDDLEAVTRHLGIDRFHIVGTGAGAFVAVDFALSFQDRLRSMSLANSVIDIKDDDYQAMMTRTRPEGFYNMPVEFRELSPSFRAGNPEGLKAWLDNYAASRVTPRGPDQPEKNVRTLKGMEAIKVPTLFISGETDNYAPPPVYQKILEHMPNAELVTIPESGHASYWERPDDYNKAVLGFLAKHH
ncbi:alpha/beta fold hydrolase [Labrys neptuniae]